jgi:hypothetical protein
MTLASRFLYRLFAFAIVVVDLLLVVPTYILATPLTQGCSVGAHCRTASTPVEVLLIAGLLALVVVPLIGAVYLVRRS